MNKFLRYEHPSRHMGPKKVSVKDSVVSIELKRKII